MYDLLCRQMEELIREERNFIPAMANASALLMEELEEINWAGFYLVRGSSLILGPFQGRTACIRIARGKGVCGSAWAGNRTLRVGDVHAFPGHIACDAASRSEIVIPIHDQSGEVAAVLDIDSPKAFRFSETDEEGLGRFVRVLEAEIDFSPLREDGR